MRRLTLTPAGLAAHGGLAILAILVHVALATGPATADPTPGFVESFSAAPGTSGWTSNATNTNPGTGGVGGVGDGYLRIARTGFVAQLGSRSTDLAYAGNWLTAGANRVKFALNDVGADQNLEIHFVIGNPNSFWLCTTGFIPPENSWAEFTVDLTDTALFVPIIDFAAVSFSEALTAVDRVHIRHDNAPYQQDPNGILGEVGVDEFKIEAGTPVGVPGAGARSSGRAVMLAAPFPNPARGRAVFAFETFDAAPVTIAVVDARGRILRRTSVATGFAGRHAWTWDGLDDAGRRAGAGVYRVRAYGPAGGTSRPLVLVD